MIWEGCVDLFVCFSVVFVCCVCCCVLFFFFVAPPVLADHLRLLQYNKQQQANKQTTPNKTKQTQTTHWGCYFWGRVFLSGGMCWFVVGRSFVWVCLLCVLCLFCCVFIFSLLCSLPSLITLAFATQRNTTTNEQTNNNKQTNKQTTHWGVILGGVVFWDGCVDVFVCCVFVVVFVWLFVCAMCLLCCVLFL